VCVVHWSGSDAVVSFDEGCEDADLVNVCQKYDKIGIDCPFGWPVPFVDAIRTHADHAPWPGTGQPSQKTFRDLLAFRCTDQFVRARTKLNPLSVSSNFIGRTAMRCALLLDALGSVDRTGQCGTVAEVYPAASLREWRFEYKGYKKPKAYAKRGELLDRLDEEMRTLVWRDGSREWCIDSDHALDALVCAITARAVATRRTWPPESDEQARLAQAEGWIHVPTVRPGKLMSAATGPSPAV
jgi:hypothetical protein